MPRLWIDVKKLEENARYERELFARQGVHVMGVNKVFSGQVETAQAVCRAGFDVIGESRIESLRRLADVPVKKCLMRSPAPSEVAEAIAVSDLSLGSETEIFRLLSKEAARVGKKHEVLLMVDMGDLREGIWFEDYDRIRETVREIRGLPSLEIYGIGANFNCFGAIKPTQENGDRFVAIARRVEADLGFRFPYLSGGNCTSYHLFKKRLWPKGVNQLRIGGLHEFGINYVDFEYVEGFHHSKQDISRVASDLFILQAEVIEAGLKPSHPVGEPGLDAFLNPKVFIDRGIRRRVILSVGRQDLPFENLTPVDPGIQILGQSSDHTIVDVHDSVRSYRLGDWLEFELDYTALLFACNSPGVKKTTDRERQR